MPEYYKSKKGYCYKKTQKGGSNRVSVKEYDNAIKKKQKIKQKGGNPDPEYTFYVDENDDIKYIYIDKNNGKLYIGSRSDYYINNIFIYNIEKIELINKINIDKKTTCIFVYNNFLYLGGFGEVYKYNVNGKLISTYSISNSNNSNNNIIINNNNIDDTGFRIYNVIVNDKFIFVSDEKKVLQFNIKKNKVIKEFPNKYHINEFLIYNNYLYIRSDKVITIFNILTGDSLKFLKIKSKINNIIVIDNYLYVETDKNILKYNLSSLYDLKRNINVKTITSKIFRISSSKMIKDIKISYGFLFIGIKSKSKPNKKTYSISMLQKNQNETIKNVNRNVENENENKILFEDAQSFELYDKYIFISKIITDYNKGPQLKEKFFVEMYDMTKINPRFKNIYHKVEKYKLTAHSLGLISKARPELKLPPNISGKISKKLAGIQDVQYEQTKYNSNNTFEPYTPGKEYPPITEPIQELSEEEREKRRKIEREKSFVMQHLKNEHERARMRKYLENVKRKAAERQGPPLSEVIERLAREETIRQNEIAQQQQQQFEGEVFN